GADIVARFGFSPQVAAALAAIDEHWEGNGHPRGLRAQEIPLVARIILIAQTLEVFVGLQGPAAALEVARERSGRWFDPMLVSAARDIEKDLERWCALDGDALQRAARDIEPGDAALLAGPGTL